MPKSCKDLRKDHVIDPSKKDFPLAGAPTIERKSASNSNDGLEI